MSKWFYDTFTGAATGATRCGSFIEEGFVLLVASYEWTWWTQRFTWFRPLERNTVCPREIWVVLLKSVLPEPTFLFAPVEWRLPEPFIAQGRAVTITPEARQVAPRWLKSYIAARVLMARSSKWCLARHQQRGAITPWCYCSSYSTSTVASAVFIQWWLQYKPNSMKMVFSINGVGSFWVNLKVWIFKLLCIMDH
jgi:hypothetical protein